jgi:hypothetical protein
MSNQLHSSYTRVHVYLAGTGGMTTILEKPSVALARIQEMDLSHFPFPFSIPFSPFQQSAADLRSWWSRWCGIVRPWDRLVLPIPPVVIGAEPV